MSQLFNHQRFLLTKFNIDLLWEGIRFGGRMSGMGYIFDVGDGFVTMRFGMG